MSSLYIWIKMIWFPQCILIKYKSMIDIFKIKTWFWVSQFWRCSRDLVFKDLVPFAVPHLEYAKAEASKPPVTINVGHNFYLYIYLQSTDWLWCLLNSITAKISTCNVFLNWTIWMYIPTANWLLSFTFSIPFDKLYYYSNNPEKSQKLPHTKNKCSEMSLCRMVYVIHLRSLF